MTIDALTFMGLMGLYGSPNELLGVIAGGVLFTFIALLMAVAVFKLVAQASPEPRIAAVWAMFMFSLFVALHIVKGNADKIQIVVSGDRAVGYLKDGTLMLTRQGRNVVTYNDYYECFFPANYFSGKNLLPYMYQGVKENGIKYFMGEGANFYFTPPLHIKVQLDKEHALAFYDIFGAPNTNADAFCGRMPGKLVTFLDNAIQGHVQGLIENKEPNEWNTYWLGNEIVFAEEIELFLKAQGLPVAEFSVDNQCLNINVPSPP